MADSTTVMLYKLARAASDIAISEIMIAVEEETRMTRCLDISGATPGCLGEAKCLTHGLWHALGDHIRAFLAGVSLQDVVDDGPIRPRLRSDKMTRVAAA